MDVEIVDKIYVDDPVCAVAVHGVCCMFGSLCVVLFGREGGLLITGDQSRFFVQLVGVAAVCAFIAAVMVILFTVIKAVIGLRVTTEEEVIGLDAPKHGLLSGSYADFMSSVLLQVLKVQVLQAMYLQMWLFLCR